VANICYDLMMSDLVQPLSSTFAALLHFSIYSYLLAFSHWFAIQRSMCAEIRSSFDKSSCILFSACSASSPARSLGTFFAASILCLKSSFLSFIPFFTASTSKYFPRLTLNHKCNDLDYEMKYVLSNECIFRLGFLNDNLLFSLNALTTSGCLFQ
jgi:hypothetical protein